MPFGKSRFATDNVLSGLVRLLRRFTNEASHVGAQPLLMTLLHNRRMYNHRTLDVEVYEACRNCIQNKAPPESADSWTSVITCSCSYALLSHIVHATTLYLCG